MKPTSILRRSGAKFILIGGNGYYGRNYQYFLSSKGFEYVVIDKAKCGLGDDEFICDFSKDDFYEQLKKLKNFNILKEEYCGHNVAVVNFAAISFVDYSINHPEETIENNYNCCVNGLKLCKELNCPKYVYISTDEVNVDKEKEHLSPYVISKRKCEEFLINNFDSSHGIEISILRPVNLMGTMEAHSESLNQKNPCLLKKIADVIGMIKNNEQNLRRRQDENNSLEQKVNNVPKIQIHGTGNQRRMFMEMKIACEVLHLFVFDSFDTSILDITEYPEFRTQNLRIKDIVQYLSRKYGFAYEHVEDPRGIYQDDNYMTSLVLREYNGSMKKIVNSLKCFL